MNIEVARHAELTRGYAGVYFKEPGSHTDDPNRFLEVGTGIISPDRHASEGSVEQYAYELSSLTGHIGKLALVTRGPEFVALASIGTHPGSVSPVRFTVLEMDIDDGHIEWSVELALNAPGVIEREVYPDDQGIVEPLCVARLKTIFDREIGVHTKFIETPSRVDLHDNNIGALMPILRALDTDSSRVYSSARRQIRA